MPRDTTTSAAPDTFAVTTTVAATTTTSAPTLEEPVLANMQGAQLDVVGTVPAPLATTMLLHSGTRAVELDWESQDRWCLAKTFKLSITDAKSETNFGLRHDLVDTSGDCVGPGDPDHGV